MGIFESDPNLRITLLLLTPLLIIIVLWKVIDYIFFRQHTTSNVLNALFTHFKMNNEKPIEFRIIESKAKSSKREFEVKTIQQKYYSIAIKRLKVVSVEPITGFSISEKDSYMRGVIDPISLDKFEITVKDSNK